MTTILVALAAAAAVYTVLRLIRDRGPTDPRFYGDPE
jgi:hypothetical protein